MKAKLWMEKNLKYVTLIIAAFATVMLIWKWGDMTWIQRLVIFMYDVLALHELEEMLTGFAEANTDIVEGEKEVGLGQLCLFCLSIYMPLIAILCPKHTWLLLGYLILGVVELFAHISAIRRGSNGGKRYNPGMVTAFTIVPGVAVWAIVYVLMNHMMIHWWWWIFAILHFILCFLIAQFLSVRSMGMKYTDFWKGVRNDFRKNPTEEGKADGTATDVTAEKTDV